MERVPIPHSLSEPVSLLVEEELPALVAFDAPWFGAERGAVLASYWADNPQRAFVVRDVHGQISGYLIAQPHALGPWVARTVEDTERLLARALTFSVESEPGVFVSVSNRDALRLLKRYGFGEQRVLSHMRKGKCVQRSRHTMLYGQASLGFG